MIVWPIDAQIILRCVSDSSPQNEISYLQLVVVEECLAQLEDLQSHPYRPVSSSMRCILVPATEKN